MHFPKDLEFVLGTPHVIPSHFQTLQTDCAFASRIALAYHELTLVTAGIFRKYDLFDGTDKPGPTLELYETTRERDVNLVADLGVAAPAVGSKGVRLLVK